MYSIVTTAILNGIEGFFVQVEADVSDGLPVFDMVGFLAAEVRESKERVRTALKNCGFHLPAKRITVNLSPANVRKVGNGFDLPITVAILGALGIVEDRLLDRLLVIGELGLNGDVLPIDGMLSIVCKAKEEGFNRCMIPVDNYSEAMLVQGLELIPVSNLKNCLEYFHGNIIPTTPEIKNNNMAGHDGVIPDFADVNGQPMLRRACEISVSGMHHLLMIGPPGAGKSMVAKRIPGILPPMEFDEQMEVSKIYSACGMMRKKGTLIEERPFRAPHHTISMQGLAGGGVYPKPGEISLAHRGVLFLDELPDFHKTTLEVLRQPLEDGIITISRVSSSVCFPSKVLLVCAMNPCKCGFFPDMNRCRCSKTAIRQYLSRISQPLLDRIDICAEAKQVGFDDLVSSQNNESSDRIRKRVLRAHELQKERFAGEVWYFNSQIPTSAMEKYCGLGSSEKQFMAKIFEKLHLSARSYHKILRVARTIADLDGEEQITKRHLIEAVSYRSLDKKYWEG